jgi:hypothetical protein
LELICLDNLTWIKYQKIVLDLKEYSHVVEIHRFQMKQTEIYFNSQPTKLFSHHGDFPDFLISNQVKSMQ